MIEITPQMKALAESMFALEGEDHLERVRHEPEVLLVSVWLVIDEFVHTRRSNHHITLILQEAFYPKRLQAAREFLERERSAATSA